ncbi:hypothetical protein F5148DRAFT_1287501 [Russula earlei]|uniref:Uncharacterized protein n=1 Tax=Russula earlei TaxID=71964 RepID=A0ACC0U1N2_9AGAM|nr:hypothetical protein F5148DRAFT_1287501 [Russula earlei]
MTNYQDPIVLLRVLVELKNFWHTLNGLYIWEFFTTLDYEWNILRGHRPYRWTIWIYTLTRTTTLAAVILTFINLDMTTPINCQVTVTSELIFSYISVAAASLLIVLRVVAIWNKIKIIIIVSAFLWVTNVAVIIRGKSHSLSLPQTIVTHSPTLFSSGIVQLRAVWDPALKVCFILNSEISKPNIIVTLISDIFLLLTMLGGLMDLRRLGGGTFGIGRLLWNQGVIWLVIAIIAEATPMILIILNLNGNVASLPVVAGPIYALKNQLRSTSYVVVFK